MAGESAPDIAGPVSGQIVCLLIVEKIKGALKVATIPGVQRVFRPIELAGIVEHIVVKQQYREGR